MYNARFVSNSEDDWRSAWGISRILIIIVQGEQNRNKNNNNNNCRIIQFKGLKEEEEEEKGLTLNIFMRLILNNLTDYNNLN